MTPMKRAPNLNFETNRPFGSKFAVCGEGLSGPAWCSISPNARAVSLKPCGAADAGVRGKPRGEAPPRRRAETAEDALIRYRAKEMLRLLDEVGKLAAFNYYFSLKVLDHMELTPDGKLAVVFLSGIRLTI